MDSEKASFWGSPLQRLTGIKPSLQNKRRRLKRKQRGAKRNPCISWFLGRHSNRPGFKAKRRKRSSEKTGYQTFTETIFCLSHVNSCSPRPTPSTHLSFHSHGSFSLIWIPTVSYITDSASITVNHVPFTEPTVR